MCDINLKEKIQGFSVRDRSICVIGCGGLGTNVAAHLAGAGAGKIYLCDFDKVNQSNLNRQFFYTAEDIGQYKVSRLKERLSAYSPVSEIIEINKRIEKVSDLSFCDGCDAIICAVDNKETREIISEYSRINSIPTVFGAIEGFYGTAYLYVPEKSPCPRCAGIISETESVIQVSSTAGIIGSMQAALILKYLSGDSSPSGKIFIYDSDIWEVLPIMSNKNCKSCNFSEVI